MELAKQAPAPVKAEEKSNVQPVDPVIFDILLSNEVNRRLKQTYGKAFLIITTGFTLLSYAIIVLNSIFRWNIPTAAIVALIVEAPLQMIGILYIMAYHLFPSKVVALEKRA
jgi:hypothetical protein